MIDWRICAYSIGAAFLTAGVSAAAQPATPFNAMASVDGTWKIVDSEGKVVQDCDKAQRFQLHADRTAIRLTEPWASPPFEADYGIILAEESRILTIIKGEERKTEDGDPVLWWFHFEDANHFRFRRYDWPAGNATSVQWVRCNQG